MADLLKDIVNYLTYLGVVQGEAIDCFCDYQPEEPDNVVILQEYVGPPTTTGVSAMDRNIQVIARCNADDPVWAKDKIWEIFNLLDRPEERVLDLREVYPYGTRWGVYYSRGSPFKMGVDPAGRIKYVFNFGVTTYRD